MQTIESKKSVKALVKNDSGEELVRHGDVLLLRIKSPEEIKNEDKLIPTNSNIVQEGEVTGHAHRLQGVGSAQTQIFANIDNTDEKYVAVIGQEGATINHEEHKQKPVEEGLYKVVIERELDPTREVTQRVFD